jgi:hypothetical protein
MPATSYLPLNHFQHFKRLQTLRRCTEKEAINYLMEHVDPAGENWLDKRYGESAETRPVDLHGYSKSSVIEKIQGLPRDIRPVTDGPYLENFSFFRQQEGLLGIQAGGVKILDFELGKARDTEVFRLVHDLLPEMTYEEYRVYNTFNSQYLRLVREPDLFTMPRLQETAVDAGCYVGYKALAMA